MDERTKRYVVRSDGNSRASLDDRNRDVRQDARMLVALVALILTAGTAASAVVLLAWRGRQV
jgi:hypothetical protein